jgi:hypothetical protein
MESDPAVHRSLCLTPREIEEITQKKRYAAQQRMLRAMGLESKARPDGSVFVDRAHYEEWGRGGRRTGDREEKTQPRWEDSS